MNYTVYLRTNKVNGKQYVGQTNDWKRREYNWYNTNWSYAGRLINNARNKYGADNFETTILKECETIDDANKWEMYYIKELNTKYPFGYNLTDGGEGSIGCVVSDETRRKLSELTKGENNPFYGKHHSEETIEKLKNRVISDETRRKLSEAAKGRQSPNKGKHLTEETKKKLSESRLGKHFPKLSEVMKGRTPWNTGKHWNEDTKTKIMKTKGKKVYQYTLDGELVKVWNSTKECGRNGFCQTRVAACCRGEYGCKTYKGYKWSYEPL